MTALSTAATWRKRAACQGIDPQVFFPESDEDAEDAADEDATAEGEPVRVTQCISTQVGCAMGCGFCLTGKMGIVRNLTAGEIVSQVRVLARALGMISYKSVPLLEERFARKPNRYGNENPYLSTTAGQNGRFGFVGRKNIHRFQQLGGERVGGCRRRVQNDDGPRLMSGLGRG